MCWILPTGHGSSLQSSVIVSILLSLQFFPPSAGLGLLHSLIRFWLPPSQVDEQESHSDQLPQLPSGKEKYNFMSSESADKPFYILIPSEISLYRRPSLYAVFLSANSRIWIVKNRPKFVLYDQNINFTATHWSYEEAMTHILEQDALYLCKSQAFFELTIKNQWITYIDVHM